MPDVLQTLFRLGVLIGLLVTGQATIQQVLQEIYGGVQNTAREHEQYAVETIAANGTNTVNHPTHGNAALLTAIQALGGGAGPTIQDVLDAIANLPAGSNISIPDSSENALSVWAYNAGGSGYGGWMAWTALQDLLMRVVQRDHLAVTRLRNAPLFGVYAPDRFVGINYEYPPRVPEPDFAALSSYDSVLEWLTATETHWEWEYQDWTGLCVTMDSLPGNQRYFCLLTATDFAALKSGAQLVPPIWPGAARATLGTPVNLTDSGIVTATMHGILLTINSVDPGSGRFQVGPFVDWYRGGYVIFVSAEGHTDTTQFIGPEQAVYTPKSMSEAASVVIFLNRAADVTVTPWLLA